MRSVVLECPEVLSWMDVPEPVLTAPEHVLIEVGACGICGSDLRYYRGENPWALHTLGRHIDNPPNIIMGHEYAGTVVAVNDKRFEHLVGRPVGAQSFRVCGECEFCRSGRENLCPSTIHLGHAQGWGAMDLYPGAYGERTIAWGDRCFPMPDHVTFDEAAMADILCVGVHANGRVAIRPGDAVVCIGGGPAGMAIAQVALVRGAGRVFVSDPSAVCRRVAAQYDGIVVIDPAAGDVGERVRDESGGKGVSAVFDTVGSAETWTLGLSLLGVSGTFVNLAVHDEMASASLAAFGSERTVTTSSNAFNRDVAEAYGLLFEGKVDVKPWLTHRFPLAQYREAFDLLLADEKQAFKVVLLPGLEGEDQAS